VQGACGRPISPPWNFIDGHEPFRADASRPGRSQILSLWPAGSYPPPNEAGDDEAAFDPLRRQASKLLSHPVVALHIQLSMNQDTDFNGVLVRDLSATLAEARYPDNSHAGVAWSKRERRWRQAQLLGLSAQSMHTYGAVPISMGEELVKVSTWQLAFHIYTLVFALHQPALLREDITLDGKVVKRAGEEDTHHLSWHLAHWQWLMLSGARSKGNQRLTELSCQMTANPVEMELLRRATEGDLIQRESLKRYFW
jgi:hypothetical protein